MANETTVSNWFPYLQHDFNCICLAKLSRTFFCVNVFKLCDSCNWADDGMHEAERAVQACERKNNVLDELLQSKTLPFSPTLKHYPTS